MALVSRARFLSAVTMIAAPPKAGQGASVFVSEYRWAVDNHGLCRIVHRNFNNIDSKQCGAIVTGQFIDATR